MIGQTFLKKYVVASELGQGSMGRVFLARDRQGQEVVVKLMDPRLAKQTRFRQQFQQELDCMRRLQHPGIVALLEGSLDDPLGPCLVMEHVRGHDLEVQRKRQTVRRFPPARIAGLMGQLCQALHFAHQQGVVHRDLKPSNLMVTGWGQAMERLKVIDFGLARWAEDYRDPGQPATGRPTGSPAYSSPEQIRGQSADPRSDLYSVGVILFELLTGKLPFRKATAAETYQAHLREAPPRFAAIDAALNVPPALEMVVQICLAKEPGGRPNSALDLGERLERAFGQRILENAAPRPAAPAPVQRPAPVAPPPQRARPTAQGNVTPPRPTLHEVRPLPDDDGATGGVAGFRPDADMLNTLAGFVRDAGGRLVENNSDGMRALMPVSLNPAISPFAKGPTGSGSGQLVLTELELRWEPRKVQQTLRLAFRPLSSVSVSLVSAWRGGCERLQEQIQELVGQA